MKDVNYALRVAYVTSLNGLTVNSLPVPVYYMAAPESEQARSYITLNQVTNVDVSTKNSPDTNISIQVQIHTWDDAGNAGKQADDIAAAVFAIIYPNSQAVLDLSASDLQMVSTTLSGDQVQDLSGLGNRVYINRILTFTHNIYHL